MAPEQHPGNPVQASIQGLTSWFDSLPKPQIRLPWQHQHKSTGSDTAASSFGRPVTSPSYSRASGTESSSLSWSSSGSQGQTQHAGPVNKDDLGRATWTFLHVLASQYPARPTKSQQRDIRVLVDTLTRIYPCAECASNFLDIVRKSPPSVGSGKELQQWMCQVHNEVNKSLSKPNFNCSFVDARWGPLDCGDELACALPGK